MCQECVISQYDISFSRTKATIVAFVANELKRLLFVERYIVLHSNLLLYAEYIPSTVDITGWAWLNGHFDRFSTTD